MATQVRATQSGDKFILRFHGEGQRSEIKARAALNKRSMNAEILLLIEQGLSASKLCPSADQG